MKESIIERGKEKLLRSISLPEEVVLGLPEIIISGGKKITIENHRGIIKFEKDEIEINSKIGKILITGVDFEVLYIGTYTLTISGIFKTISYEV